MKKKFVLIILFFSAANLAFAQYLDWYYLINRNDTLAYNSDNFNYDVNNTNETYLIVGYKNPLTLGTDTILQGTSVRNFAVVKLNPDGEYIYSKNISTGNISSDEVIKVIASRDNGFFLIGTYSGFVSVDGNQVLVSNGARDILVMKFDLNGTLQYSYSLGSVADEDVEAFLEDANGSYYIAGKYHGKTDFQPGSGVLMSVPADTLNYTFVAKYDASNTVQYMKTITVIPFTHYSHTYWDLSVKKMVSDSESNFYLSINTRANYQISGSNLSFTYYGGNVLKFDNSGTLIDTLFIWINNPSVFVDSNDDLIIGGQFTGYCDFDPSEESYEIASDYTPPPGLGYHPDIFIAKYDNDLNFVWVKHMGYVGPDFIDLFSVDNDNIYSINNTYYSKTLSKYHVDGSFISSVDSIYYSYKAKVKNDNLYIGYANGNQGMDIDIGDGETLLTARAIYVSKYSGDIVSGISITNLQQSDFQIFPNPASTTLTIQSSTTHPQTLKIVNMLGQIVFSSIFDVQHSTFDISNLNTGLYHLLLEDKQGRVQAQKLVVAR